MYDWTELDEVAESAIQGKHANCYALAAERGQMFENVGHMSWFHDLCVDALRTDLDYFNH